jgi:uncharacterized protein YebE (UPF0316 family)
MLLVSGEALYTWFVLPSLIFLARILDVSLGTVRVVFVSRGFKYLAPVIGFFEVLVWILAIGQIMKNLANPACYVAYAGGFAMGNFVGMHIAEKLSLGLVLVRIIARADTSALVECLRAGNYGVTIVDAQGAAGPVKIVFTVVPRRELRNVAKLIRQFNPGAFYTIGEVDSVEKGVFPLKRSWRDWHLLRMFRPFRKGK